MNTRRFLSLMVVTMSIFAGTAFAGGIDGKALYRDNCRVCHDKGSPHKQYTPMTLTQAQWRSFSLPNSCPLTRTPSTPRRARNCWSHSLPSK